MRRTRRGDSFPHRRGVQARRPGSTWGPGLALLLVAVSTVGCGDAPGLEEWTLQLTEEMTVGGEPVTPQTALYRPAALGFDFAGNLFVLDSGNHRIQVFAPDGSFLRSMGEPGEGPGQLGDPQGMFVHPDGRVWVADTRNRRVQPFSPTGAALDGISVDLFPIDVVVGPDRIFVLRMPQTNLIYGADPSTMVRVLDRSGFETGGFADPVKSEVGILYMLENMAVMAPGPSGGVALASTHFASLVSVFDVGGSLRTEIPVLYKAGAWAPLGRRPALLNDASLDRIARTATDLAWDEGRRLFWVLCGYVDQSPEGEWTIAREIYRYDAEGTYRGSLMLPQRAAAIAVAPDGRLWTIDVDGVVHAFRVSDPDMDPRAG